MFFIAVQSAVLKLVGNLVKDYPDSMENELQGIQIRDMFFKTLESAVINRQDVTHFICLQINKVFIHSFLADCICVAECGFQWSGQFTATF